MVIDVIISDSAKDDLKDIKNYISRNSPEYADLLLSRIFEGIENLKLFPMMGRVVPEFNKKEIRELICQSYRIIYVVSQNRVEIISIVHGARLLK